MVGGFFIIPNHSIDGVKAEDECGEECCDDADDGEGWSDGDCVEEWLEDEETGDDE